MSVTYSAAAKTARLQAVRDLIAAGSGPGVLQIGTTGFSTVLVSIPLTDPPVVAQPLLTLLSAPATEAATGSGTAAVARVRDSNGTDIITGLTVGVSAADVILDSVSVTSGQDVTISTAVITHP